ncbi:MAG TPA: hypothetical protein VMS08_01225 [Candidatus Saccharimonadia bacterium]|nr:hypothetical protein [Candidatus Saccharimonadia bacterium]
MNSESELSWHLSDYIKAGAEPPARCISNPELSEGEMMSADEVEQFIVDSIATLRVLSDHNSPRMQQITTDYYADLAYLLEVGSLTESDYNELIHPDNLHF